MPHATRLIRRHAFPALLALGLITYELLFTWLLAYGQPPGTRWLGDSLQNSGDVAVYLSYIRQGATQVPPLLQNLFAVEPHAARFDLFWSGLSAIYAWTKASPILIHEIARAFATLALAFSLHAAARSVAKDEREARLGSLLAAGGIGLGWLYSAVLGATNQWSWRTDGAPDIVTEFAVVPTLLGGAHMILSMALLIYVMRGVWEVAHNPARRLWTVMLATAALTAFHPYFIPLIVAALCLAWVKCVRDATRAPHSAPQRSGTHTAIRRDTYGRMRLFNDHDGTFLRPLLLLASLLPSLAYYLWLLRDPAFRVHHLQANFLPLASPDRWLFALLPAALALAWLARRHDRWRLFLKHSRWCLVWLVSAAALALLLPVPWSRKLTEGLMVPLALLTLPAWSALFSRLPRLARSILLAGLAGAAPLHMFASQAAWLKSPEHARWFNRPEAVFRAWSFLETRPNAVIVSDDAWTNIWTPAWTGKTVWTGHNHETPDFKRKQAVWKDLFAARDRDTTRFILQTIPVTHLLLTSKESARRMTDFAGTNAWTKVFEESGITVLERK